MMKISKIIYGFLFVAAIGFFVTACNEDDEAFFAPTGEINPLTIAELTAENTQLSNLSGALGQSGVDSILRTTTTYTFFAPQNEAFNGVDVSGMSEAELDNFLMNHVVPTVTADFVASMATGYVTTMAIGPDETNLSMFVNVDSGLLVNGVASGVDGMTDIGATNGVLHVVNGLLAPATVVDHAMANPDFSSFAEALELSGIDETLNGAGPFTLFAPNNAAFESFMAIVNGAFGWASLSDVPTEVLERVVMYHALTGENMLAELVDGDLTTMQGEMFNVTDGTIDDASYDNGSIVLTDVQGVNGVVHGIDKVLLPEAVFQSVLSANLNLVERSEDRGFSTFVEAAELAGLTDVLAAEDADLTVFAPNNDGFVALFALIGNFESLADFDTPEEIALLKDLLEYQMVSGQLMSSNLIDGGVVTTIYGDGFTVDLSGDEPRLKPSFEEAIPSGLVNANIGASNGIIHEINRVMVPDALVSALGIETDSCSGPHPVGDPDLVFFDWDANGAWWGAVAAESDASISIDGSSYGRANLTTSGGGWNDMFWRNDAGTFNGASTVGSNLDDYVLKFDINTLTPISEGTFKLRFHSDAVDAFYDWAPWSDTGEALDTEGNWITVEIPLSVLGQPDFSQVNQEFGMAFDDGEAPILLNFAIDNVRFDAPGYSCGGPDPVADTDLVFFDWDANGAWWGAVAAENDASISLDGSSYGRANLTSSGGGWNDMFWRNDAGTFNGASTVGTNIDDYSLKFDIYTLEPISAGTFKIRFHSDAVDAFYDWAPWNDTGEPYDTGGWTTVTIPLSVLGQPDFGAVNQEFGMAFDDGEVAMLLNFAIDNVRFEAN
ncbi:putative surface protein with fasciclin (FAS1) repeats [Saonia flava]|uniref:Putative surface protein with fasciclin (FAS1) repeats n=1 Tax=Saonia flava TaxID=523696 RepID=A0A846R031_9FLAO|nr:glycan-binding surface protein [Saonia flava]NJB72807.1 putative surface protein with fasciclin (FAS1) repeats [Saonia flava]